MMKFLKLKVTSYLIGKIAEKKAVKFLKKNKWTILKTNYKTSYGEIDILAEKDSNLVAYEVKFRADEDILPYVISKTQKIRIQHALEVFIKQNKKYNHIFLRFDVLLISKKGIQHIENAWDSYW